MEFADIMENAMESLRSAAGGDTVMGEPITTASGTVIIPVSKVSMGFVSGGADKNPTVKTQDTPKKSKVSFGGGGGSGMTVTPISFLVIAPNGEVKLLNIAEGGTGASNSIDSVGAILEKTPDIISKIKGIFTKKEKTEKENGEASVKHIDL